MKKPRTIVALFAAVLLPVSAGCLLWTRATSQPRVTGHLRPEDPPQIQRAVSRYRWTVARESLAAHDFAFVFSSPFLLAMSGRVREIGALPDRTVIGLDWSTTNASSAAYAISTRGDSQRSLRYDLKRTTNGWAVVPPPYYTTNGWQ